VRSRRRRRLQYEDDQAFVRDVPREEEGRRGRQDISEKIQYNVT